MIRKKLRLDDLAVESFDVSAVPGGRGTVLGREVTEEGAATCADDPTRGPVSCAACSFTCPVSCNGTCTLCTEGWTCYGCPPE